METLILLVQQTYSWRGRASRKAFFLGLAVLYGVGLAALPLQVLQLMLANSTLAWLANILLVALGLACAVFFLGNVVRRLHDRNKNGWWLLVFFGPQVALVSAMTWLPLENPKGIMTVMLLGFPLAAPMMAWGMAEILAIAGVKGPNRYGPDPLEAAGPVAAT